MKNTSKENYRKNRVYGIIGMVALFMVGAIFGFVLNGADRPNRSVMTEEQCQTLTIKLSNAVNNSRYDEIEILNKIYSQNCLDRVFPKKVKEEQVEKTKMPETTCGQIQRILSERLYSVDSPDAEAHIDNAKIYANLSERGCPENSQKYKELAKKELEIARALNDDILRNADDSIEIVETYKRLQMQAEAEKMIEKAKKLTNPAIDFIIQLEKIIEE